ncbi:hypothetical protein HGRIS_004446 [Hohenbuehelia grisea]|uniref:Transposase n=1 Tax=Hohenbuehelia grisea TaxID=104357 RepID=A0ABR3JBV8_9AGAR
MRHSVHSLYLSSSECDRHTTEEGLRPPGFRLLNQLHLHFVVISEDSIPGLRAGLIGMPHLHKFTISFLERTHRSSNQFLEFLKLIVSRVECASSSHFSIPLPETVDDDRIWDSFDDWKEAFEATGVELRHDITGGRESFSCTGLPPLPVIVDESERLYS